MALNIPLTCSLRNSTLRTTYSACGTMVCVAWLGKATLETQLHNPVAISHMWHAPLPSVLVGLHLCSHLATGRLSLPLGYLAILGNPA